VASRQTRKASERDAEEAAAPASRKAAANGRALVQKAEAAVAAKAEAAVSRSPSSSLARKAEAAVARAENRNAKAAGRAGAQAARAESRNAKAAGRAGAQAARAESRNAKAAGRAGAQAARKRRSAPNRKAPSPSLTVRGIGMAAGGVMLGLGVGLAVERALVGHDRRRDDPEAGERFGRLRGTRHSLTSFDGTRLHVEEFGSGPCLVFSHGFSLTQDAWHYQRRDLPASFRCVFFDQRGHGRSGRPRKDDYSLRAFAEDLRAVIDWTGESRVVVIAHSLAGMAALQFAALFPEEMGQRLAGLVLVDTTYADALRGMTGSLTARGAAQIQRAAITAGFRFIGQDPVRANQLRRRGSDFGYLGTRLFGFGSNPSPSQVAFTDRLLAGTDVEVWAKVFPSLIDFDLSEVLEGLALPTLIVCGDKDRLTPPAQARHMASKIAESRLLILEDAGHMAFLEEHEVLDAEITEFARQALGPKRRRRIGGVVRRTR
jgi:pimeloyl-ACP methyl ester carboxylesterase